MTGRIDKIEEFDYWLRDSPFSGIVIIAGNHDIFYFRKSLKKQKSCCQSMTRFTTLRTVDAESMVSHFTARHGSPSSVMDGHSP